MEGTQEPNNEEDIIWDMILDERDKCDQNHKDIFWCSLLSLTFTVPPYSTNNTFMFSVGLGLLGICFYSTIKILISQREIKKLKQFGLL